MVQNSSLGLTLGFCSCMIFACNLPYSSSVGPSAFEHTYVTKQQKKSLTFKAALPGTSYPWGTGTWVSLMLKSPGLRRRFSLFLGANLGGCMMLPQTRLPPTGSPHLCWVELLTWLAVTAVTTEDTFCLPTSQGPSPGVPAPEGSCLAGRRQRWRYGFGRRLFPKCAFVGGIWVGLFVFLPLLCAEYFL